MCCLQIHKIIHSQHVRKARFVLDALIRFEKIHSSNNTEALVSCVYLLVKNCWIPPEKFV